MLEQHDNKKNGGDEVPSNTSNNLRCLKFEGHGTCWTITESEADLLYHTELGNCNDVHELLTNSNPPNPNCRGGNGRAPLHIAARLGHVEIVQMLISNGANINQVDNWGENVLMQAVLFSKKEDKSTSQQDEKNLMIEVINGEVQTTPRIQTNQLKEIEIIKMLFSHNKDLDLNHQNAMGMSFLHFMALSRNPAVINFVFYGKTIEDSGGATSKQKEAQTNLESASSSLIDLNKLNLNLENGQGETAFMAAISSGNLDLIKALCWLDKKRSLEMESIGLNKDEDDNEGYLLDLSVQCSEEGKRRTKAIQQGLEKGKSIEESLSDYEKISKSSMVTAHQSGNLIDMGDGDSCLMCAARISDFKILEILLSGQFDQRLIDDEILNLGNAKGITPLMQAAIMGEDEGGLEIARMLLNCGRRLIVMKRKKEEGDNVDPEDILDLNLPDNRGNICIHYACGYGYPIIVELFLQVGQENEKDDSKNCPLTPIDLNTINKEGITPLLDATKSGRINVVQVLIDEKKRNPDRLDLKIKDRKGKNARARAKANGFLEMEKILKEAEKIK